MSHRFTDQAPTPGADPQPPGPYQRGDLERYYRANQAVTSNRDRLRDAQDEIQALEHSEAVEVFQKQVDLLLHGLPARTSL